MKNMIYTTVRKPSFMVKMALITVLFIAALIEQVSNTGLYANSFGTQEHMTVILLLIHTFSYSDFYQNIFFIGFIFLIPDIVKEEYDFSISLTFEAPFGSMLRSQYFPSSMSHSVPSNTHGFSLG